MTAGVSVYDVSFTTTTLASGAKLDEELLVIKITDDGIMSVVERKDDEPASSSAKSSNAGLYSSLGLVGCIVPVGSLTGK